MVKRPVAEVDAKAEADRLDRVFHALAHSTRRGLLARLAQGEWTMGELAAPFGMSLPAIAKHIQVLEDAGLIRRWREGRTKVCGLEASPLVEVMQWVRCYEDFWETRLDSLELMFQVEGEEVGELAESREDDGGEEVARPAPQAATDPGHDPPRGGKKRAAAR